MHKKFFFASLPARLNTLLVLGVVASAVLFFAFFLPAISDAQSCGTSTIKKEVNGDDCDETTPAVCDGSEVTSCYNSIDDDTTFYDRCDLTVSVPGDRQWVCWLTAELKAKFTADDTSGTAPHTVTFTNQSTGIIQQDSWTFGDGGTSSAQNPTYIYTNPGTYTVILKVTDFDGKTDTETKTNYITVSAAGGAPSACFTATPSSGPAPLDVTLDSSCSTGTIDSRIWSFGDGSPQGSAVVESHTYNLQGSYQAKLIVSGPGGNDETTRTITVNPAGGGAFTVDVTANPTNPGVGDDIEVTIEVVSGAPTGAVEFGVNCDNDATFDHFQPYGGPEFSHTFPAICGSKFTTVQNYTLVGRLTDSVGAEDSKAITINVGGAGPPEPTAKFTWSSSDLDVQFGDNSSSACGGGISSWDWDFGDGNSDTVQNPTHTYAADGSYTVQLAVTDCNGNDSTSETVEVTVGSIGGGDGDGDGAPTSIFITFPNPLGSDDLTDLINNIIDLLFTVAVIVAPILLVVAGIIFMTAAGDPGRIATARRMLIWTVVGFGIILISKGLVEVLEAIIGIPES